MFGRRGVALVVAGVVGLLCSAAVSAAPPPPGSTHVHFTLANDGNAPVFFLDKNGFLPNGDCGFAPAERTGTDLEAYVSGWETPPTEPAGTQQVSLHATVYGTVTDTAGNVYRLAGSFSESGQTTFPSYFVPFDGFGHLVLAGPAGVVAGTAEFRDVTEGPPEWDFHFGGAPLCILRP